MNAKRSRAAAVSDAFGLARRVLPLLAVLAAGLFAADVPSTEHVLQRDDLVVVVATATGRLEDRYGPRFDRTAQVVSIKVAGREWLAPDGMPDEYAHHGDGLPGYGDTAAGTFLKPGVGLLRTDETDGGRYFFAHPYVLEKRGEVLVERGTDWLEARQEMPEIQGLRLVLTKHYRLLARNELEVRFTIAADGAQRVYATNHYNHHFFRTGEGAPDGRYRVAFFGLPDAWEAQPRGFTAEGGVWRLLEPPARDRASYVALGPSMIPERPAVDGAGFRLKLPERGVVEFSTGGNVVKAAVWAGLEGFCPELFVEVVVPPGGATHWIQRYRFLPLED